MASIKTFDVIDENNDFIVINKYPNVDFHCSDDGIGIVAQVSQALNGLHLFPVHRLDKMTSGLLIMAKSSKVASAFGELFEQRLIEKYYIALSDKKPKKKQGLIKGDMKKGRNGSYLLLKTNENPAITQFFSYSIEPSVRLFLLKPHTGKTHQLRVAMKSIGSPIIGDNRYYSDSKNTESNRQEATGKLHAWKLSFTLYGQQFSFEAKPRWSNVLIDDWLLANNNPETLSWPSL